MAFTFKESSSYLFNKDDQEYIFNKRRLINSSAVQLNIKKQYIYIYWKLYNTHLEIQFAPTLTDYVTFKINLPKNMTDNIQFKEDKKSKFIYMFLLSNDGIIFKYTIDIKSKEIVLQNQYIIKCIQKQKVQFFKAIDQDNFVVTTTLNEVISVKRLKDESIVEKKQNLNSSILRNFSKFITNNTTFDFIQDISYIKFNKKNYVVILFNNILYILNENLKFIYDKQLMKPTLNTAKKFISIYDLYIDKNNEYASFNLCILLENEFHIFKMIIDQNDNVSLNDDFDVLLPVIESIPLDEKRSVFINTFQITYINNHFILWVEQKDTLDKSAIKYLYLDEYNKLGNSLEGHCPEIWLPLITNNIIENADSTIKSQKIASENSNQFNAKETVINIDDDKVFPKSLSTLSFSNFSLLSDINDIPSMPSYDNNNYDEDEQDSIELIQEYYMNYIFNINKFSLSILYYALLRYSEESSISAYVDQTELKHIGLNYIKKCIINCINERINSNAINGTDRNNIEKEYKKFLYYCIMEYESENKFVSFLQYSKENVRKVNVPMFILIKRAYITTVNLCDTSEIFYNALTNKHSMMELQYLFSITDLNKKNSYHNVSSSMSLFLSAIDQLYRNQSSVEKFGINKSNQNMKNSTLNIQQLTRDVIVGICKSSMQLENLVENIYLDYLDDNENFLKKIRKLRDVEGCIDYVFSVLSDRDERIIPLETVVRDELKNNGTISKSYITYLTQLISVNVKEVINARYHLCFHLFIILIALYIIDKKNDSSNSSIGSHLNRVGLFNSGVDHFKYLNYLYRCKSYLHALIILKWASEYSDSKDQLLNGNEQIMELNILKNLSISNTTKKETNFNGNDIVMNAEKVKYILTYFKINKINVDDKIDKTVLTHANDSLLFHLIYSSVLFLIEINEDNSKDDRESISSNIFDTLTSTNYFSLYPSDLVKQSISLLDIVYDYSHRYLDNINLSWYSKESAFSSPLVSFIIQLIQHSSNSITYLKELLPSINSSCVFLLQGIISLISNDIEKSEEYFKKAGAAFVAKTVDSSIYTFLPVEIENAYQYYQYIMHLYENIGLLYGPIEKFANLSLLHIKDDNTEDDLNFVSFNCLLNTLNFEEAFLVIQNITNLGRKKQLLREFVIKICEIDQTLLFKFNFSGCKKDIESILIDKINETTNPLSTPNYNKILYSYLIYNGSYRKAALYMYKFAQILYKSCKNGNLENSFKSLLVEQSKALLITINALSLVDKKNQYLTIEGDGNGNVNNVNITLLDIRKEYYLSLSKLELSKNHKESETSILSLDPVDAVTLYISLGKYDTAISFSLLYGFDLSIIFQNLLLQYVKSSFMIVNSNSNYITDYFDKVLSGKGGMVRAKDESDEKGITPTINLPDELFMQYGSSNNITIYNYKKTAREFIKSNNSLQVPSSSSSRNYNGQGTSIMNSTVDFRELLKKFLDLHDSPDNYYRYHKVVIEKFLETCITSEVPGWLIEPFMNQFPEDLIRIYIKYNRIKEAALFTIKLINNMKVTQITENTFNWFPFTVIDQLICIMEERSQKDSADRKLFIEYINTIKENVKAKYNLFKEEIEN